MLFVWIMLWSAAGLLLIANRRNPAGRWLSFVAFCGGMGALASVLDDWIAAWLGSGAIDVLRTSKCCASCSAAVRGPATMGCRTDFYASAPRIIRICSLRVRIGGCTMSRCCRRSACCCFLLRSIIPCTTILLAVWALPYFALGTALW